ncbi:hypothetical protein T440DRAFT_396433, partial [Plenodomus tracheiphilus IPT5]
TTTTQPPCASRRPSSHNQAARGYHLACWNHPRANHNVSLVAGMSWPYLAAINSPPRLGPLSRVAQHLAMQAVQMPR